MKNNFIYLACIWLLSGTISVYSQQFQQVLQHYKNDSLKLRAAQFLIDNLDAHHSYQSTSIDSFYHFMDSIFSLNKSDSFYKESYDKGLSKWGKNILQTRRLISDSETVTDNFLIKNIDDAFQMWQRSWNGQYDFDLFCRYILPYRAGQEPLSDWRSQYIERYAYNFELLDNIQTNFAHIYGLVNRLNRNYHATLYYPRTFLPSFSLEALLKLKAAPCGEYSNLYIGKLRAFGIPVAIDFVPQWGTSSMGHEWNVLIQRDGTGIPFGPYETLGNHTLGHCFNDIPKVYRKTFEKRPESLALQAKGQDIPYFFKDPCIMDVTTEYTQTRTISIPLYKSLAQDSTIVYLAVFNNIRWVPVTWGIAKAGHAEFKDMGCGIVYLPVKWTEGQIKPVGDPFLLERSGHGHSILPDLTTFHPVTLTRKYHPKDRTGNNLQLIAGGKFQVANQEDFSDSITLFTIPLHNRCKYERVSTPHEGKYLYFRYLAPKGSHGIMAEVCPLDKSGKPIPQEELIGNKKGIEDHGIDKLFDGDLLTTFESRDADHVWAGIRFSTPTSVSQIRYLARNDDNDIRENELYELFYWANGNWNSLGKKTGNESGELQFKKVPNNALYLLHNHTKGREERIFTYENEKQIWW